MLGPDVAEHLFNTHMVSLNRATATQPLFTCVNTYFLLVNEAKGGLRRVTVSGDTVEVLRPPDELHVSHSRLAVGHD